MRSALRRLALPIKLALAAGAIVYLIYTGQLDLSRFAAVRHGWMWLIPANLMILLMMAVTITRWRMLMHAVGIPLRWGDAVRLTFIGFFFNTFMPGAVGGDLVKAWYAAKESPGQRAEAATAVLADRAIGLTGLVVMAALAMVLNYRVIVADESMLRLACAVLGILVAAVAGSLVLVSDWFREWTLVKWLHGRLPMQGPRRAVYDAVYRYKRRPGTVAMSLALSVFNHATAVGVCAFLALAIDYRGLGPAMFAFVVPLGLLANAIPVTPGGWGIGELAFVHLFALATGDPDNPGAVVAALLHLWLMVWSQIGLLYYLRGKRELDALVQEAGTAEA